jgi:DNA gyrase subunit A
MATLDVELVEESQIRYLTYALSVVNSRALPDIRDGLKPVQRRILYAMLHNLNLKPENHHRKSAAVVGEVLARYHPHGDGACYEAMVRMAQTFSYRYPLVDGQGNFGSLDGDSAAAYRYTEAKLTPFALEVIGDINDETVAERPNFDQTTNEPVVLPSRVPNLLLNGASGIAVGMATSIPPHNLKDVMKALTLLVGDPTISDAKLVSAIKGPDFPTGCLILNTAEELKQIYMTGRGAIRMRAGHKLEGGAKGKSHIVFTSVPYGADKSVIVEKIADLIISKKLPQVVDVRDESTEIVRVVLDLAPEADAEKILPYLFKQTPLQQNFNVNLTGIIPTANPMTGRPAPLALRGILETFVTFRIDVTTKKLIFEKRKLEERIHLLEGLERIYDILQEIIDLVRKCDGRADSAKKLQEKYKLSELQAYFIVDLRIYQLSKTSIEEVRAELKSKRTRVKEINKTLGSDSAMRALLIEDFDRIVTAFGDARRSVIVGEFSEENIGLEELVQHEEAYVVITRDGWFKRLRTTNDPQSTRLREGDSIQFLHHCSTKDSLALITNRGNLFVTQVYEVISTPGFGEPVQKMFKFDDGESVVQSFISPRGESNQSLGEAMLVLATEDGYGFQMKVDLGTTTKKNGRRLAKISQGDALVSASITVGDLILSITRDGYAVLFSKSELSELSSAGKGVIIQKPAKGDKVIICRAVKKKDVLNIKLSKDKTFELNVNSMTIGERARKGERIISKNTPVIGI